MQATYHYYTVKTLASYAGFDSEAAQLIAYFSNYIDCYIMNKPFVIDRKPPDFFLKNGLATELYTNKWIFSPCATGVNIINTSSHNYQLHTLMPFHFIMPLAFPELPENPDRSLYRCVTANQDHNLLINRLLEKALNKASPENKPSLMALGMLLHTYADTYSHCGFSGFHGWENQAYIAQMDRCYPKREKEYFYHTIHKWLQDKLLGKLSVHREMGLPEKLFYSNLPSIGHGNVYCAPDYCECKICLLAKTDKQEKLQPFIERDSSESFADCSRNILNMLCQVSGKPALNDDEWQLLQKKLSIAQSLIKQGNHKTNKRKWSMIFPDIEYNFRKNEFIDLKFERLTYKTKYLTDELAINNRSLLDMYSEAGDQARAVTLMLAKDVSDLFFTFNELAYEHVYQVTGEYASPGKTEQMFNYHELALSICPQKKLA
ncbi:MAG: hypothetical protein FWF85_00650 [Clostridiales bacterium]|jgi:hypothetical protein|nr:hypothetical protein [Clostridiales bacterium]MDR2712121.1 hypothetical protein [Clostridiales bacterium]